ncbi:MAG: HIT family protein [bacterium]
MSDNCVFCKIVRGELPSTKLYEDDQVLAFMDIGPIVKGHVLVIPKQHVDPLTATPPDLLAKVMTVVQKVVKAQMNGLKADGVNVHQSNGAVAGQVVPHVHFHVIPRFATDGHTWNWATKKYENVEEMQKLAEAMKSSMS